ncbi:hypothetical protein DFA_06809 [Cavenderia fasciculata]|uniref:Ankyrin repeat-containing protein n=1 Tax=Cavenderia fasciculata TaxID=261658 RepID=F4Q2C2_CACFS|nr:uncharacterized protein DFA_06809 [Cavenderia fasciculata]EGG18142.1 hypothetical protein DFA_06809 [Cavenderia fasciculata]|eukprot:XP_004366183.1 hypothetical protein DFA_06809 [Cavenderia fasciculata]
MNERNNTIIIFKVIRSKVLWRHILSFLPTLTTCTHIQTKYKDLSYKSISYLTYRNCSCTSTSTSDIISSNNINSSDVLGGGGGRINQKERIEQQQRSFNQIFKYKLLEVDDDQKCHFIVYFRALPVLLRNCRDVVILKRLYTQYPYYFGLPLVRGHIELGQLDLTSSLGSLGDCKDSKSWVVDNVAASNSLDCLLYTIRSIGIVPTNQTLDMACEYGSLKVLDYLHNSYPLLKLDRGFELASLNGHLDVVRFLLDKRTEMYTSKSLLAASRNKDKSTNMAIATLLFDNIERRCSDYSSGPLPEFTGGLVDSAVLSASVEMVELYYTRLGRGAITRLALDQAAELGYLDIVMYLDGVGAPASTDAMEYGAKNGHLDIITYLFEKRSEGCTKGAMQKAAAGGFLNIVQFLHTHEDAVLGHSGRTFEPALECAATSGVMQVVQFMHQIRNEQKVMLTPVRIIQQAKSDYVNVIKYLFENGIVKPIKKVNDHHQYQEIIEAVLDQDNLELYRYIVELYNIDTHLTQPKDKEGEEEEKIDTFTPFWKSLLHHCRRHEHPHGNIRLWLLKTNKDNLSPRHYATLLNHAELCLLQVTESINELVELALSNGSVKCFKYLQENCQLQDQINPSNKERIIDFSSCSSSLDLVQYCYLNYRGGEHIDGIQIVARVRSYFFQTIKNGDFEIIKFLIDNHIHLPLPLVEELYGSHEPRVAWETPFSLIDCAAMSKHYEVLLLIIQTYPTVCPTKIAFRQLKIELAQYTLKLKIVLKN